MNAQKDFDIPSIQNIGPAWRTEYRIGALYIRVSTHDQDELSPDSQIRLGLDFAKNNQIIVPREFIFVESVSGRNVKNRHEFQRMIGIAKSPEHPIDIILVWKFSRFARNQEESIVYKSMLKKDNVDVLSISEPIIDGPFGSLIERIIEWMDEYYSIRLSGDVLRGMKEKALQSGYQQTPPLGYVAVGGGKPFVIDEEEYKIIDYMKIQFDVYDKDCTYIARQLNAMGYRTRRGNLFEARGIKRILTNPFYYGLVDWNGTSFMGTHEVRLSKEEFDARMLKIKSRYRPIKRRDVSSCSHWLSGILKCGHCGASLTYNKPNHSPGFQCYKYAKGIHPISHSISEKKVIAAIYEYFENILNGMDFEFAYKTPAVDNEFEAKKNHLLDELKKLELREQRIALAFENGIDSLEEYSENKKRLKSMRADIQTQLDSLETPEVDMPSKEDVLEKVRTVYDVIRDPDIDYTTKGSFMRDLVECIIYYKETNTLEFHLYIS